MKMLYWSGITLEVFFIFWKRFQPEILQKLIFRPPKKTHSQNEVFLNICCSRYGNSHIRRTSMPGESTPGTGSFYQTGHLLWAEVEIQTAKNQSSKRLQLGWFLILWDLLQVLWWRHGFRAAFLIVIHVRLHHQPVVWRPGLTSVSLEQVPRGDVSIESRRRVMECSYSQLFSKVYF